MGSKALIPYTTMQSTLRWNRVFRLIVLQLIMGCVSATAIYGQTVIRQCANTKPQQAILKSLQLPAKAARVAAGDPYYYDDTTIYKVPLVVHVIHKGEPEGIGSNIPDEQVFSQIRILNEDFNRMPGSRGFNQNPVSTHARIVFELAQRSPDNKWTNGIVRVKSNKQDWNINERDSLSKLSYWDEQNYLNIWVCNIAEGKGYLGYAEFPVSNLLLGLDTVETDIMPDGIIVGYKYFGLNNTNKIYNLGRTITHEMGHYLGLIHVWGDGRCNATDFCSDTPVSDGPSFDCLKPYDTCLDSAGKDMTENYMNFTYDSCMNLFTQCQIKRMRTVLQYSPKRASLPKSLGLITTSLTANLEKKTRFVIFPNPGSGLFSIRTSATASLAAQVQVYDIQGRAVNNPLSLTPTANTPQTLNLQHLPTGIYIINISTHSYHEVQKIIIQH